MFIKLINGFKSCNFSKINTNAAFRSYAHNLMKKAHGENYSKDITDKVVDDLLKNNPDAEMGELIGRLTSGLGNKNFSDFSENYITDPEIENEKDLILKIKNNIEKAWSIFAKKYNFPNVRFKEIKYRDEISIEGSNEIDIPKSSIFNMIFKKLILKVTLYPPRFTNDQGVFKFIPFLGGSIEFIYEHPNGSTNVITSYYTIELFDKNRPSGMVMYDIISGEFMDANDYIKKYNIKV